MGPRIQEFETAYADSSAASTRSRCRAARPRCTSLIWRWASGRATRWSCRRCRSRPPRTRCSTAAGRRCSRTSWAVTTWASTSRTWRRASPTARRQCARCTTRATPPRWTACASCATRAASPWSRTRLMRPAPSSTGRKLGTWGSAGCFSFFSNKVLSVGEGGLLATDDDEIAERVRSLRSHGMTSGTLGPPPRPRRDLRHR